MFISGHVAGTSVVHLTVGSVDGLALCGETSVDLLGEPDLAVICEQCDAAATARGGDPADWRHVPGLAPTVVLRQAA